MLPADSKNNDATQLDADNAVRYKTCLVTSVKTSAGQEGQYLKPLQVGDDTANQGPASATKFGGMTL